MVAGLDSSLFVKNAHIWTVIFKAEDRMQLALSIKHDVDRLVYESAIDAHVASCVAEDSMTVGDGCCADILRRERITESPFLVPLIILALHVFFISLVHLSRSDKLGMLLGVPVEGTSFIRQ